jgi:signal transduction histidine kinase
VLESRDVPLVRLPVDLAALLTPVVQRAAARMTARPVRVEIHGTPPIVSCDAQRIEQVVSNLVANAEKYGYERTEIVVTVEPRDGDVQITVCNDGDGIPAIDLDRVFERFYRVPGSPRGRGRGLGLGLYIAKGLVEAHGGRIWIESETKKKTRVCFTLPVAAAP